MDHTPGCIQEVTGIGSKRSEQILNSYTETRSARKIITLLAPLDVSATQAISLQRQLGCDAEFLLKRTPYAVYERGLISFAVAEKLAEHSGIAKTDPARAKAALLYTLEIQEHSGHLRLHKEDFIRYAVQLLSTPVLNRMAVAQSAFSMLKGRPALSLSRLCLPPHLCAGGAGSRRADP